MAWACFRAFNGRDSTMTRSRRASPQRKILLAQALTSLPPAPYDGENNSRAALKGRRQSLGKSHCRLLLFFHAAEHLLRPADFPWRSSSVSSLEVGSFGYVGHGLFLGDAAWRSRTGYSMGSLTRTWPTLGVARVRNELVICQLRSSACRSTFDAPVAKRR